MKCACSQPVGRTRLPSSSPPCSPWRWTALHTARAVSSEEDCLTELLGPDTRARSDRPWLRVDIKLSATLDWGKAMALPSAATWAEWVRETLGRLERIEPLLPEDAVREGPKGRLDVLAWRDEPELAVTCAPDGALKLEGVSLAAGQLFTLPRQWSDSEKRDASPDKRLRELFARLGASLRAWSEVMDHLRPPRTTE